NFIVYLFSFILFFRLIVYGSNFFFFASRRRHTRYWRDWSSDVCSSDLSWRRVALLWRLAWRNLARRRAQTAIILAGLLLGGAVITASLTVADSLRYGIRKAAFDAYGPADEFVQVEGQMFVPQELAGALANDSELSRSAHALSPVVLGQVALRDGRTHARVSATGLEGFDPAKDAPFGKLREGDRVFDGSDLANGEA